VRFREIQRTSEWLTCVHRLNKLLAINRKTGIQTRAAVSGYKQGFATGSDPPTIIDLDEHFRSVGVDLATRACETALQEAGIAPEDITHTVAVTCTNQGSPGYNLLVHEKLGLRSDVDHTLLHGVGCAGGLSIMRVAAQMALASTARGRPARVLAFACELCTPNVRSELAAAEKSSAEDVCVAAALFSDAAAAFVLTNSIGKGRRKAKFQLLAFDNAVLPRTMSHMSYFVHESGKSQTPAGGLA
jgi:type III polyketide synthase